MTLDWSKPLYDLSLAFVGSLDVSGSGLCLEIQPTPLCLGIQPTPNFLGPGGSLEQGVTTQHGPQLAKHFGTIFIIPLV